MTAHTLRTWGLSAVPRGDPASRLSPWISRQHHLAGPSLDKETQQLGPCPPQGVLPPPRAGAMRSPCVEGQCRTVAVASRRRRTAMRSRFCGGIATVPELLHPSTRLRRKATSCPRAWPTVPSTGKGRSCRPRRLSHRTDLSRGARGTSSSAGTTWNLSQLTQRHEWR